MLCRRLASAALLICICAPWVRAEDAAQSRIIDGQNAPQSQFPTVGKVDLGGSFGSGTLIAPRFVLTAAHVVTEEGSSSAVMPDQVTWVLNSTNYKVRAVTVHPTWNWELAKEGIIDMAILELEVPILGVAPSPLNRAAPDVGELLTLVGYGTLGTGETGENQTFPMHGTVQWGTTPLDGLSQTYLKWLFEKKSGSDKESSVAHGDSGGPAFITRGPFMLVAGVAHAITAPYGYFNTNAWEERVDTQVDWIDSIADTAGIVPPPPPPPQAELVVGAVTPAAPFPVVGQPFNVTATIYNLGAVDASPFVVCAYLSDATQPASSSTAAATVNVAGLAAGASMNVNLSVTYPAGGQYTLAIKVDADNVVPESNDLNNTFFLPVTTASQGADLIVKNVALTENPQGQNAQFTVTVQNLGMAAAGAFSLGFWQNRLSAPVPGDVPDMSVSLAGLASRATADVTMTLPSQTVARGGSAWFMADYGNVVAEDVETNNTAMRGWGVANQPPAVPSDIAASGTAVTVGASVTLSIAATDPEGDPLAFLWNFGDGTSIESGPAVTHVYSAPGLYTVSVSVSDGPFHTIVKTIQLTAAIDNTIDLGTVRLSQRKGQFNFPLAVPSGLNKKKDRLSSLLLSSSSGAMVRYSNLRARGKGLAVGTYTFTVQYISKVKHVLVQQRYKYTVVP